MDEPHFNAVIHRTRRQNPDIGQPLILEHRLRRALDGLIAAVCSLVAKSGIAREEPMIADLLPAFFE